MCACCTRARARITRGGAAQFNPERYCGLAALLARAYGGCGEPTRVLDLYLKASTLGGGPRGGGAGRAWLTAQQEPCHFRMARRGGVPTRTRRARVRGGRCAGVATVGLAGFVYIA